MRRPEAGEGALADAVTGHRPVYFRGAGFVSTPCYARGGLAPGMVFDGPAIIEQDDATPLVAPGFRARVDAAHNILLERSHA
jgi:N-methylhydantoinase A